MPVKKRCGELIYAGGKQKGTAIELEVLKEVQQSYLTQLWNNDAYRQKENESTFQLLVNRISHWFTIVIVGIALFAFGFWFLQHDIHKAMNAFTAVLIIACPCALAISSPFTLGNILRIFGRNKFYLKNAAVIEKLAKVDTIVFDKTGTLTYTNSSHLDFTGDELSDEEQHILRSIVHHSSHPLSRMIYQSLPQGELLDVLAYNEIAGKGIEGIINENKLRIGSRDFLHVKETDENTLSTRVYVSVNGLVKGYYAVSNRYREGLKEIISLLSKKNYCLAVLSGDNESERDALSKLFGSKAEIRFNQSPGEKLQYVQQLQKQNRSVLMMGDGLNDAGALKQSDTGISVSDDVNNFSPACDGILDASRFSHLPKILSLSISARRIIISSFIIALLYNAAGLWFAVQGNLSPVIAAILMPLSAVTIVSFTTGASNLIGRK
jgi:Cu+-exporting ATPase